MAERPLRKVAIIDVDRAPQRLRQVFPGAAAAGRQDLTDAAVAALHPAVGLRMARWDEAVLNVLFGTAPVAAMLAGRCALAGGAATVGKFLAVSGEDRGDLNGGRLEAVGQEALGAGRGLFRQDLDLVVRFIKILTKIDYHHCHHYARFCHGEAYGKNGAARPAGVKRSTAGVVDGTGGLAPGAGA